MSSQERRARSLTISNMPEYSYKAKNLKGEEEQGIMEAGGRHELTALLRKKGYFLVSAEGGREKKKGFSIAEMFSFFWGVSISEKLFFTRNLAVMIRTGVPLPRAFAILARQAKAKKFKKALEEISSQITKGRAVSSALGQFPKIFSELYRETMKVGEETGKLEETLRLLAQQIEREHQLKSRVKSAMIYPIVIVCAVFLIGVLMMIFAVPSLQKTFTELQIDLPLTTRIFLTAANFLIQKWPLALLIIGFLVFIIMTALKSKKGGKTKSALVLKMPLFGGISQKTNSALVLRTLSSMFKAGVPVVRAMEITAGAVNNFYFKKSLLEGSKIVERGKKISLALKDYQKIYSPMVLEMIEVGEETGATGEVLEKLADFFEEQVKTATERLSSVIEPLLILFVGGLVGLFAISMVQPMFSIMEGIK